EEPDAGDRGKGSAPAAGLRSRKTVFVIATSARGSAPAVTRGGGRSLLRDAIGAGKAIVCRARPDTSGDWTRLTRLPGWMCCAQLWCVDSTDPVAVAGGAAWSGVACRAILAGSPGEVAADGPVSASPSGSGSNRTPAKGRA